MQVIVEHTPSKLLIGQHLTTSLANNRTAELWRSFMRRCMEITNNVGPDLYSLQIYPSSYFSSFNPITEYEKWALMEVTDFEAVPDGMEAFTLPAGQYAVFPYKGDASGAAAFFQYIFGTWLPASEYELDNRPHFEVLGDKYKNNHPDSEEEVWIPVKVKG